MYNMCTRRTQAGAGRTIKYTQEGISLKLVSTILWFSVLNSYFQHFVTYFKIIPLYMNALFLYHKSIMQALQ